MRRLLRICGVVLLLCCLPCSLSARPSPAKPTPVSQTPLQVAKAFWLALGAARGQDAMKHAWTPFHWDTCCSFVRSKQALIQRFLGNLRPGVRVTFLGFRWVREGEAGRNPAFQRKLDVFRKAKPCSRPRDAADQALNASFPMSFVTLYVVVNGTKLATVTKLSYVRGRWLVSGFDN